MGLLEKWWFDSIKSNFIISLHHMTKIQFNDPRSTITISLPSFPWSEIVMVDKLLVSDQSDIMKRFPNVRTDASEGFDAGVAMVERAIKSHNFFDWETPIIMNAENLKKLPTGDLEILIWVLSPKDESKKA